MNGKHRLKVFTEECLRWRDKLGLTEWDLEFSSEDLKSNGSDAEVHTHHEQGKALLILNSHMEHEPTADYIKSLAKHEMLHILLDPLGHLATERSVILRDIDKVEHQIVNRLMKVLK